MPCSIEQLVSAVKTNRITGLPVEKTRRPDGSKNPFSRVEPPDRNPLRPVGENLDRPGAAVRSAIGVFAPQLDVIGTEQDQRPVLLVCLHLGQRSDWR